jgi:hypothetical protein
MLIHFVADHTIEQKKSKYQQHCKNKYDNPLLAYKAVQFCDEYHYFERTCLVYNTFLSNIRNDVTNYKISYLRKL